MRRSIKQVFFIGILFVLFFILTGCGSRPIYFMSSPPLLYGMEGSDDSLLVIQQNDKFGYADATGKIVIKPQYLYARPFHDGVAAVKGTQGKFGYIDKTGRPVIPFRLYGATDFHNGVAFASDSLTNAGELNYELITIIDTKGKAIRQTTYTSMSDFSDGIAFAYQYNSKTNGYDQIPMDLHGAKVDIVSPDEDSAWIDPFSEGIAYVRVKGSTGFFVDKTGTQSFVNCFVDSQIFSDGLAAVQTGKKKNLWGYIDKTGKLIINESYLFAGRFGQGIALVEGDDGTWEIIDADGKIKCSAFGPVDTALSFAEGLCAVGKLKGKYEYYHSPCPPYKLDYDWGFIDTTGKLVIDFQYDLVTPFKNGIAQVLVDGRIGYIDKTGKYIWEPK